jgi:hypothetical protein
LERRFITIAVRTVIGKLGEVSAPLKRHSSSFILTVYLAAPVAFRDAKPKPAISGERLKLLAIGIISPRSVLEYVKLCPGCGAERNRMDTRSEAVLAKVNPGLAKRVRNAADKLASAGTNLLVVSGLRTAAEQNALFAQGRGGAAGHVVTNARAGYSMHNYGLAVDIVPYLSGDSGELNWESNTPQFRAMVTALEAEGLVWGGEWKSFPDDDHFQMPGLPVTPNDSMRSDYGDGGYGALANIWNKASSGGYTA